MARHKRDEALEEDEPKLDISSLIDATFLLLIYFLVTTTIQPRESDVPMKLPSSAPSDKQPEIEPRLISIEQDGRIFVGAKSSRIPMDTDANSRQVPLLYENLRSYKETAEAANTTPVVQIWVDGEASQQRVIDVMNALTGVGIRSVTFTDLVD
jgi:biopolymer transport protein ExbD